MIQSSFLFLALLNDTVKFFNSVNWSGRRSTPRKSSIMLSHNFVRKKFMEAFLVLSHFLRG